MMQVIIAKMLRAIEEYQMIDDGDKVAVALSGGKDSIVMLQALLRISKFYKKHFTVMAITIDPGLPKFNTDELEKMCNELEIEYIVYKSNIADVVFNIRKEKNPCSLCANMRKGMINSIAVENGCTKIALGHHMDDVMETFLMSLFFNGKVHTFAPVAHLSRSDIKTIRPMIYVEEKYTKAISKVEKYPVLDKYCPQDGITKREDMTILMKSLTKQIPKFRENLFGAITRAGIPGWNKVCDRKGNPIKDDK